ncbi:MAG: heat-inducible transcription repressor HrcA [Acidobacteria bacterium]|nr:MAG: heat-inducible transcription repressor HrcA [Acidobacteriota bacterium]
MEPTRLSERSRRILAALVGEYVETGEPVASATLVRRGGFGLSSATVRNVLASLEEQGYVYQPHTSSGRVPTDLGYRCYVNMLMEGRRPGRAPGIEAQLLAQAGSPPLMEEALTRASHVLSAVSHHVGFAVGPDSEEAAFQRIDFVPLADTRVLVVVVTKGGQVTNKVVDVGETLPADELHQAANYLNEQFAGLALSAVRAKVIARLAEERTLYDTMLSRALRLAQSTFEGLPAQQHALFIEGAASLIEEGDEGQISLGTLRTLLRMIEEKHRLVRLLTEYMEGPGLTVIIGTEHTAPDLREFSLVAATYTDGDRRGAIGVLGPTRMRYSRAISIVDSAARTVTRLLQQQKD